MKIVHAILLVVILMASCTNVNAEFAAKFDPYYSYLSYTTSFFPERAVAIGEELSEGRIYRELFVKSFIPGYLLTEFSYNPLPAIGGYVKQYTGDIYNSMTFTPTFNLIRSLSAGFEEPWALTFFLGEILGFKYAEEEPDYMGVGYSGFLLSYGDTHIKDNTFIGDSWLQGEWKIKGARFSEHQKLVWSFRIGGKYHGNPGIKSVYYFAFDRSRTDYGFHKFSFIKNAALSYQVDFDSQKFDAVRHYLLVSKKFPIADYRLAVKVELGFVWERSSKYAGVLKPADEGDRFQLIIRPNVEF
ncbi:MAG: hypothetical protein WC955_04440 [Elusimicrobiota bacterium]